MKKFIVALIVVIGFSATTHAQLSISLNIGTQPVWGPVGYDHADYYYLPEAGVYYNVSEKAYYYRNGNSWAHSTVLPARYGNINLYQTHKVVLNNVRRPYLDNARYEKQYSAYRFKHDQVAIRDSRDEKYFQNHDHPMHAQWEKSHGRDRGHH